MEGIQTHNTNSMAGPGEKTTEEKKAEIKNMLGIYEKLFKKAIKDEIGNLAEIFKKQIMNLEWELKRLEN